MKLRNRTVVLLLGKNIRFCSKCYQNFRFEVKFGSDNAGYRNTAIMRQQSLTTQNNPIIENKIRIHLTLIIMPMNITFL